MKTKKQLGQDFKKAIEEGKIDTSKLITKSLKEVQEKVKGQKEDKKKDKKPVDKKETKKKETPVTSTKKKSSTKDQTVKETAKRNKTTLIQEVVVHREIKYIYPADCKDTLSMKAWRQKTRRQLEKLERAYLIIKDQNSKEFKAKKKEYDEFRKTVLKAV